VSEDERKWPEPVRKDAVAVVTGVETTLENVFQTKMEHDADLLRIAQEEDVEKC